MGLVLALQQLQLGFCAGDARGFLGLTSTEVNVRARAVHTHAPLCGLSASSFFPCTEAGGVCWGCWNNKGIQTVWPLCVATSAATKDSTEILNCPVYSAIVPGCSIFIWKDGSDQYIAASLSCLTSPVRGRKISHLRQRYVWHWSSMACNKNPSFIS